ncbi:hypothetical protein BDF19DRAFT_489745 [Syncephalis fuscata]|nr:hypothetical protein BDF19DRAFT_489745 [Syncephalis fuscata]
MEQVAAPTFGAHMDHGEFHTTTAATTTKPTTNATRRSPIRLNNGDSLTNIHSTEQMDHDNATRPTLTRVRRPTERALASYSSVNQHSTNEAKHVTQGSANMAIKSAVTANTPTSLSSSPSLSSPSFASPIVSNEQTSGSTQSSRIKPTTNHALAIASSSTPVSTWTPEPLPPIPADASSHVQFDFSAMHPDDARDKVFVAIIRALVQLGNRPSSPKELASAIMRFHFAVLGGSTPYATVSSPGVGQLPIMSPLSAGTSDMSEAGTPVLSGMIDGCYDDVASTADRSTTADIDDTMELSSSYTQSCNSVRKRPRSRTSVQQQRPIAQKRPRRPSVSAIFLNNSGTAVPGRPDEMPRWRRAAFCLSDGDDGDNDDDDDDDDDEEDNDDNVIHNGLKQHYEQQIHQINTTHVFNDISVKIAPIMVMHHQLNLKIDPKINVDINHYHSNGQIRRSASVSISSNHSLVDPVLTRPLDALMERKSSRSNNGPSINRPLRRVHDDEEDEDEEHEISMVIDDDDELDDEDDEEAEISDYADDMMNGLLEMDDMEPVEIEDISSCATTVPLPICGKFDTVKSINVPASPSDQLMAQQALHTHHLAQPSAHLHHTHIHSQQQSYRSRRRSSLAILGGQGSPSFSSLVDALSRASGEARGSSSVSSLFGDELIMSSRDLNGALFSSGIPPVVPPPPSPIAFDTASIPLTDLRDPESMSAIELDRLFGGSNGSLNASSFKTGLSLIDNDTPNTVSTKNDEQDDDVKMESVSTVKAIVTKDSQQVELVDTAALSTASITKGGCNSSGVQGCINEFNAKTRYAANIAKTICKTCSFNDKYWHKFNN